MRPLPSFENVRNTVVCGIVITMIMMMIMLFTEHQECAGRDRIHLSAFCASIVVTADVPLSADSGTARGWSSLKTYIFVYMWAVVGWSDFFFFF